MEQEEITPQDIQNDAGRLYHMDNNDGGEQLFRQNMLRIGYTEGAIAERGKGIWTDQDLIEAMEFIGTCDIKSNSDLLKWSKYFMEKQKLKK